MTASTLPHSHSRKTLHAATKPVSTGPRSPVPGPKHV
ncbi:MAG: hypothetical protein OJF61_002851 [Rhodanobacteraceae bacterium]|nr:MAG: hypothetical protein OJF61_002851 [Rhodanobacteraceae bacterium]